MSTRFRDFAWILFGIGETPFRRFAYIAGSFIFGGLAFMDIARGATTVGVGLKWFAACFLVVCGLVALWKTCNGR